MGNPRPAVCSIPTNEPRNHSKHGYRSMFTSDIHLGFSATGAETALDFLHSLECEHLALGGEIFYKQSFNEATLPAWGS
ncbi:MAG: hypothetical protein ACU84Q_15840 [Gammaproteobacteria bacterium]